MSFIGAAAKLWLSAAEGVAASVPLIDTMRGVGDTVDEHVLLSESEPIPGSNRVVQVPNQNPGLSTNLKTALTGLGVDISQIDRLVEVTYDTANATFNRRPNILVIGGGAIGPAIAEQAQNIGFGTTLANRTGFDGSTDPEKKYISQRLLANNSIKSTRLDASVNSEALTKTLKDADVVFVSHALYASTISQAEGDLTGFKTLIEALKNAGFTQEENAKRVAQGEPPKRVVYVDSPVRVPPDSGGGPDGWETSYQEDALSLKGQIERIGVDRIFQTSYFWGKIGLAALAKQAALDGLDIVSVAPTYVVGPWGDHGGNDPVVLAKQFGMKSTPSTLTNAISTEDVGRQALSASLFAPPGEYLQLAGTDQRTGNLLAVSYSAATLGASMRVLPDGHTLNSDANMVRSLRLLQESPYKIMPDFTFALLLGMKSRSSAKARAVLGEGIDRHLSSGSGWRSVMTQEDLEGLRYPDGQALRENVLKAARAMGEAMRVRGRFG